jgi:hypothetical protein
MSLPDLARRYAAGSLPSGGSKSKVRSLKICEPRETMRNVPKSPRTKRLLAVTSPASLVTRSLGGGGISAAIRYDRLLPAIDGGVPLIPIHHVGLRTD